MALIIPSYAPKNVTEIAEAIEKQLQPLLALIETTRLREFRVFYPVYPFNDADIKLLRSILDSLAAHPSVYMIDVYVSTCNGESGLEIAVETAYHA